MGQVCNDGNNDYTLCSLTKPDLLPIQPSRESWKLSIHYYTYIGLTCNMMAPS